MKNRLFFLIILLALVLRFSFLGSIPASLDWDEASLGYNAYSLLKTGNDEYGNFLPLSIRSFNDYKPPLYTYLTVLPTIFFGMNEFSTRFISAVFGIIGVIAVYFLILELFNVRLALLTSFLLSVSPWHLQFSRVAFEANVALTLIILGILYFVKGVKKGYNLYYSALFFGFSVYAYHSPRLIVPLIILGLSFIYLKPLKLKLKPFIPFLLLIFLFYLPVIRDFSSSTGARFASVSVINPDEKLGRSIIETESDKKYNYPFGSFFHNRRIVYGREVLAGYLDHFNFDFLFLTGDAPGRHHAADMGMLYLADLPLIIVGLLFLLRNLQVDSYKLILWLYIVAPVASAFTSGTPHAVRSIFLLPAYMLFSALGISRLVLLSKRFKPKKLILILPVLFFVFIFSINIFYYLHQYYVHTPVEYAPDWQYGYKQAVGLTNKYGNNVSKIIFTYHYDQPYVYFLYYNSVSPAWYQANWGAGEINRSLRNFSKYEFRNIDWAKDKELKNVLIVGTPAEIPETAEGEVARVLYPDGNVAFRLVLR